MTAYDRPAFEKGRTRVLGHSVTRLEDPPLVTGRGRYVGDLDFARQLHMRVVRSDQAHARIRAVGLDAVRGVPGVVAAWSAADIADLPPIDFRDAAAEAL